MIEKNRLYAYEVTLSKELDNKNLSMLMDYIYYCYYLSFVDENLSNVYLDKARNKLQYIIKHIDDFKLGLSSFNGILGLAYLHRALYPKQSSHFLKKCESYLKYQIISVFNNYNWKKYGNLYKLYDIFTGITGIGKYFLNYTNDKRFTWYCIKKINEIILYDDSLLGFKEITKHENKIIESINWGTSHGMISAALFLHESIHNGYIDEDSYKAKNTIIKTYMKNYRIKNNIINWPSVSFLKNNALQHDWSWRMSWCYGNIGILRILYLTTKDDRELNTFIEKQINSISLSKIYELNLNCPTFCHGYSGPFLIMKILSKEIENPKIKNNINKFCEKIEIEINKYYNKNAKFGFYKFDKLDGITKKIENNTSILEGITSIYVSSIIANYQVKNDIFLKETFIK